jgi:hypothetical protein
MMPLTDYYNKLEHHDWFHMMSDDARVNDRGHAALSELRSIAKQSEEHKKLFDAFQSYVNGKGDKPSRPAA